MPNKKVFFIIIAGVILFHAPFFQPVLRAEVSFRGSLGDFVPGPELLSPVTKNITISTDGMLEFKWERKDLAATRNYIFKLYKGYGTVESALITRVEIPNNEYPFKEPAKQFTEGQVYTWVLVQVFYSGRKSEQSFSSFSIHFKANPVTP